MTIPPPNLRPLSPGEIMDRAFRLYRANFLMLIGISLVVLIPISVIQAIGLIYFKTTSLLIFMQLFLLPLPYGALTWAASHIYLGGSISLGEAYRASWLHFRSVWAVVCLRYLIAFSAIILVYLGRTGGIVGVLVMLLFVLPSYIFLTTRWVIDLPCIILEGLGARASLDRSWALTARDAWHACGTCLTSFLLVYLLTTSPGVILDYTVRVYKLLPGVGPVISAAVVQLGASVGMPLNVSAYVILYYDLRVRREAYDLEVALQAPDAQAAA